MNETNQRKNTLGLALCLGALVVASGVQAHSVGGHKGPGRSFQKLDSDSSGGLSLTEMEAGALVRFAKQVKRKQARQEKRASRMQAKGLTEADIAQKKAERKARREAWKLANPEKAAQFGKFKKGHKIKQLDTDGDGAVSADEITAAAAKRFQSLDADANGSVSLEEWAAARKDRKGKRSRRGKRGRKGKGRRGRGHKGNCNTTPDTGETGEG